MFKRLQNENHKEVDKEITSLVVSMNGVHLDDNIDDYVKMSEAALKLAETKKVLAEAKKAKVPVSGEKILDTFVSVGLTLFVVKHEQVGVITSKMFQSIIRKGI